MYPKKRKGDNVGKLSLEFVISAVNDLPALPQVVLQVMELTDDEKTTAQDISNVINQDQAMTLKVLKLANSAFYGFSRRISSVADATVRLGFKTIRSLVLAASVSDMLNKPVEGYALEQGALWDHSQSCALAARIIAKRVKYPRVEQAFTAALLHDIGKVIFNSVMKENYQEVNDLVEQEGIPFMDAENRVLGFDHAAVGGRIADKWKLPAELVEAIACHHAPERATIDPQLTAIVHTADVVCFMAGIGLGVDGLLYPISAQTTELLGLHEEDMENIISELVDVYVEDKISEAG